MEEGEDTGGGKKKSGAEAHGLEKQQVLRGLIDVEDGIVVIDLPNLGSQHVFISTELCFHCWGILGWRFTTTLSCHDLLRLSIGLTPVAKVALTKTSSTTSSDEHCLLSSCLFQNF